MSTPSYAEIAATLVEVEADLIALEGRVRRQFPKFQLVSLAKVRTLIERINANPGAAS